MTVIEIRPCGLIKLERSWICEVREEVATITVIDLHSSGKGIQRGAGLEATGVGG